MAGAIHGLEEAEALRKERGWAMVEDSKRGYRRVVPSPIPRCGTLMIRSRLTY